MTPITFGRASRRAQEAELLGLVDDLCDRFVFDAEITRDAVGPWASRPWTERHGKHRTAAPGLLEQLRVAATGRRAAVAKPGRMLVGSGPVGPTGLRRWYDLRPVSVDAGWLLSSSGHGLPAGAVLAAVDLLADLLANARGLRTDLGGAGDQALRWELRRIVGLSVDADDEQLKAAVGAIRNWHRRALLSLGYEVPSVALRIICPECGTHLRVAADVSSDVWCPGPQVSMLDTHRTVAAWWACGARWPRAYWHTMLQAAPELVDTAALATHLGITAGHVRLLVAKSVLAGPVSSRPKGAQITNLYDLAAARADYSGYLERIGYQADTPLSACS